MAFIPIPKDLTKVRTKLLFHLSARQLVCFGLGGIVGVPAYLFTRGAIGNSAAVLLMIGLMLPFFFLAMYEKDGQPAEKALRNIVRARFWPSVRLYRTENMYKYLSDQEGGDVDALKTAKGETASAARGRSRKPGKREQDGAESHAE